MFGAEKYVPFAHKARLWSRAALPSLRGQCANTQQGPETVTWLSQGGHFNDDSGKKGRFCNFCFDSKNTIDTGY